MVCTVWCSCGVDAYAHSRVKKAFDRSVFALLHERLLQYAGRQAVPVSPSIRAACVYEGMYTHAYIYALRHMCA